MRALVLLAVCLAACGGGGDSDAGPRDEALAAAYDAWKERYLERGCGEGRAYVAFGVADQLTVSEAHGYGMLILPMMADHDPEAQELFDAMHAYFVDHPSVSSDGLMAWSQDEACESNMGADSATDGDLDIAYGLLLADATWGSDGDIDYRAEALRVMDAIWEHEVDASGAWLLLGDWAEPGDDQYEATRSSDLMPGHLTAFAGASGDEKWNDLADAVMATIESLQAEHAPNTGLLPDFIRLDGDAPAPAEPGFLEADSDGAYSYNACRDPWRLAVGPERARAAAARIVSWMEEETGGDPSAIRAGYALDGTPLPDTDYVTMAFVGPAAAGAMAEPAAHAAWRDAGWEVLAVAEPEGYYEDTLRLLSMITLAGRWRTP
ncbi:MAG TPA: glycosyl hydrolase family 8 [Kofleriaceae bacterium]|nr:glycosyl hydrolase family 8 [Kofleriaceae bacterium]